MLKKFMLMLVLSLLIIASLGTSIHAQEQVMLRLWAHQEPPFNRGIQALIDSYMAENPNVTIQMETFEYDLYIQTLQTSMPAGDEADLLEIFGTWACSYADNLAPMPEGLVDTSIYLDAPIGGFTCGDNVYGLPLEFNLEYGFTLVSKDMFEAANLEYPPAWETWEDLRNDAVALTQVGDDGQMTVAGFHFTSADPIGFSVLSGILQNGGDYWNDDHTAFTFNTDEGRVVLQNLMDLMDAGVVDPLLFNDEVNFGPDAFFTNQAAMANNGPWVIAYGLADFPEFGEFAYVRVPTFNNSDPLFAADSGWGYSVSKNSAHADVAWDFARYISAVPDNALSWNIASATVPALKVLLEGDYKDQLLEAEPFLVDVLPVLPYGQYIGEMPDRDLLIYDIIYPIVLEMLQGSLSIDEALEFMESDANEMLE